jgi:NAD(P)-dependent dehydrogenase (short-subunit alcohol dehydrogenase family)
MRLKNKVALITGAMHGMGRAAAILFAREGAKVTVVDIAETPQEGENTVELIKKEGGEAFYIHADVSKAAEVENMINQTVEKYGRIDILYNNAGVRCIGPAIEDTTEEFWDWGIDINLKGVFLGMKYVIPYMKKQGGGVIINTASTFGAVGAGRSFVYSASKGGIIALTRQAAVELGRHHIRVNALAPGTVATGFGRRPQTVKMLESVGVQPMRGPPPERRGSPPERSDAQTERETARRREFMMRYPIGRRGEPEDIAYAALYLASDESSYVTGLVMFVDGGYTSN